jgi:hypothetical protein
MERTRMKQFLFALLIALAGCTAKKPVNELRP